jgi:hypothetical protein
LPVCPDCPFDPVGIGVGVELLTGTVVVLVLFIKASTVVVVELLPPGTLVVAVVVACPYVLY